ncbi:hypothetical protein O6H91_18G019800 [Diphasiastrum complanatum]|uniref:Uncharacterized protein n=2 Tax=Diphasiastrum complanatum TaxID=34168 RepID=A0ACC2AYL8_DIPCM|nr:hypothetical protein O6H91_18G019800 [Diphasiastrum complanatum]
MSILSTSLAPSESSEDFFKPCVDDNGASASEASSLSLPKKFGDAEGAAEGGSGGSRAEKTASGSRKTNSKGKEPVLNPLAQEFMPGQPAAFTGQNAAQLNFKALPIQSGVSTKQQKDGASLQLQHFTGDKSCGGTKYESVMQKEDARNNQDANSFQLCQHPGEDSAAWQMVQADQGRMGVVRPSKGESDSRSSQHSSIGLSSGSRRGHSWNANHLLNFQYNPIARPPSRAAPARRQQKNQPYNKEHFLQANFRFLVSDLGDYVINASDPDKMLHWEDVAAVECSTSKGNYCPICLENPPICSQITSCGHIFCFPCILRYFMVGEEVSQGDLWKKCPVCVSMINCKELRSVFLDRVQEYETGENISFALLMRAKGSIIPLQKSESVFGSFPHSKSGRCHTYSKFTLTSDMEEITNRAIAELTSRAERAQSSGGEDLDQIPYIFAAIDQLKERQAAWTEHRAAEFLSSSPPVRQRIMAQARKSLTKLPTAGEKVDVTSFSSDGFLLGRAKAPDVVAETQAAMTNLKEKAAWVYENAFSDEEDATAFGARLENKTGKGPEKEELPTLELDDVPAEWEQLFGTSPKNDQALPNTDDTEKKEKDTKKDKGEKELYTFYQSCDGQLIILHPLNMKCLLQHYGDYDSLPSRLEGKILEMETISQSESMRRRYRYLSHFPLTTTIQLCEIDLSNLLPKDAFITFTEELHSRESKRWHRQKQEQEQRMKEEKAAAAELRARNFVFPDSMRKLASTSTSEDENVPINNDFPGISGDAENLGASPPMEGRKLFSNVARLGFAAGYDAPELGVANLVASSPSAPSSLWGPVSSSGGGHGIQQTSSIGASGESSKSSMSFADVIQLKAAESQQRNGDGQVVARKGKKSSKLIMSTAGGRRY